MTETEKEISRKYDIKIAKRALWYFAATALLFTFSAWYGI